MFIISAILTAFDTIIETSSCGEVTIAVAPVTPTSAKAAAQAVTSTELIEDALTLNGRP
jgi:hypothetical protein